MALTPFRWVAMAAIGCMLAVLMLVNSADKARRVFLTQRKAPIDTFEARLRDRAGGLNQQAQNIAARYRLRFLLDSAKRVAARSTDTARVRTFVADGFDARTRGIVDDALRRARIARAGSAAPVDVFVLRDTLRNIRGVTRYLFYPDVRYELPPQPGARCRVFIRTAQPSVIRYAFVSENSAQQIMGPCGFFAAFGEPGPLVRQWLLDGGWQLAIEGSWTVAPKIDVPREDSRIFKGPSPAIEQLSLSSGGPSCLKGDLDACERAAVMVDARRRAAQVDGATGSFQLGQRRYYAGSIGFRAGEILSDAVREVGPNRFKAFWTSTDSVPAAFQKATGERWGAFIQRWMAAHYGAIEPGPRMSGFAMLASAILVIVALGTTMLLSVRRQYA